MRRDDRILTTHTRTRTQRMEKGARINTKDYKLKPRFVERVLSDLLLLKRFYWGLFHYANVAP